MEPRIPKTDREYRAALEEIDRLMSARSGTRDAERLELWTLVVERYEEKHFPIDPPDPIEAIRFRMEQEALKPADLIPYLGSKSRVSEVLNGKRPLSIEMIRRLHEGLGIPAEALIRPPKGVSEARGGRSLSAPGGMVAERTVGYTRTRKRGSR